MKFDLGFTVYWLLRRNAFKVDYTGFDDKNKLQAYIWTLSQIPVYFNNIIYIYKKISILFYYNFWITIFRICY